MRQNLLPQRKLLRQDFPLLGRALVALQVLVELRRNKDPVDTACREAAFDLMVVQRLNGALRTLCGAGSRQCLRGCV